MLLVWALPALAGATLAWNRALDACAVSALERHGAAGDEVGVSHSAGLGEQAAGSGYRVEWDWTPPGWTCRRENAAGQPVAHERIGLAATLGAPMLLALAVVGAAGLASVPFVVAGRRAGREPVPGRLVALVFLAGAGFVLTLLLLVGG